MKVVIVGGGTAGWMTAAALSKYLGTQVEITLIESDQIGTVGVGEATIPQIRLFNSGLGINEPDFLRETQGTIKLGIEFEGWRRENSRYFHGFGDVGRQIGLVPFHHYWLRYRKEGGSLDLEDFNPNARAARAGKYGVKAGTAAARLPASAYHFDAGLYADFLAKYAQARGVVRKEGIVKAFEKNGQSGFLTGLTLSDGTQIQGDLFIDCSGFRSRLLGEELGVELEDWSHWLPCDRALAVASEGNGRFDPFTRSIARQAGWQWQIPLQHRTGNGHVYSSQFTSDAAAAQVLMQNLPGRALGEPRALRFTTGKRRVLWAKNCVALGLASGFLEPLESTSIHLVQVGIATLLSRFPSREMAPSLANEFNRQMAFEFEAVRDFLILHYHLNERDGAMWAYCRNMDIPDSLQNKLDLFQASAGIVRFNSELFDIPSWLQVMWGQGMRPRGYHPMVDAAPKVDIERYIKMNSQETRAQVEALGDHAAFLANLRKAHS